MEQIHRGKHIFTCQVMTDTNGTLIQQKLNKRKRVDEKGELLIRTRSYSTHAHVHHARTRSHARTLLPTRSPLGSTGAVLGACPS
jgi:hypothetical protein